MVGVRGGWIWALPALLLAGAAALILAAAPAAAQGGCAGGEIYDDGTFENAYSGTPQVDTFEAVQQFTPPAYPATYDAVCVALATTANDGPSLNFEIEVRDDDGVGGSPGTPRGALPATADNIPAAGLSPHDCAFYRFDISGLGLRVSDGSVFIGVRWPPPSPNVYLCADQSPQTPLHPGFVNLNTGDGWQPAQDLFGSYRALSVRAVQAFRLGMVRRNRRKGTATLRARVPGPGVLLLAGKGVGRQTKQASGPRAVRLRVRAKGKAKRRLAARGRVRVKARVTYLKAGASRERKSRRVKLVKRR